MRPRPAKPADGRPRSPSVPLPARPPRRPGRGTPLLLGALTSFARPRQPFRLSLPLVPALLALLAGPLAAQQAPTQEDLDRLAASITAVQARLEETRGQRSVEAQALLDVERDIAALAGRVADLEALVASESAQLEQMEAQRALLQEQKAEQQALVGRYLRAAWQGGRQEWLKLLLGQDQPAESARLLRYYEYFSRARAARIAEYSATLGELAALESAMTDAARRLQQERGELDTRLAELEQSQARRLVLLQDLDRQLAAGGEELERLRREREDMEILIRQLQTSITELDLGAQQGDFGDLRGKLPWPAEGGVLRAFGERRAGGDLNWEGLLIEAAEGAPVHAVHHGRVVFADWFGNSGLLLIIEHGDGYMSLYAHNQLLYAEVGDWVSGGETVAAAGNSGGQAQSGVYFEIRKDGRALDPAPWLQRRP